jgi:hypothetical protein
MQGFDVPILGVVEKTIAYCRDHGLLCSFEASEHWWPRIPRSSVHTPPEDTLMDDQKYRLPGKRGSNNSQRGIDFVLMRRSKERQVKEKGIKPHLTSQNKENHQLQTISHLHPHTLPSIYCSYYPLQTSNKAKMHFTTTVMASILALTSTTFAAQVVIKNNCPQQVYLQITRSDQSSNQLSLAASGGSFSEPLQGQGNSYGLTKSPDYYSPNTPKLIFGVSDSNGLAYYSLSNVNGDAFDGQDVKVQGNGCPTAVDDGSVKACADANDLVLSLC